ncbi:hypothetical protein [Sulfobacillus thermosulfidooxidans]|uniref:hypothetical protein n=1 Tax=Sulfobacillus thermosulfidooxidans TaxID=28034 RepID=UPI0006B69D59|nr:hypothetical protein [Sulfobacillus thermosulfidooxidans]
MHWTRRMWTTTTSVMAVVGFLALIFSLLWRPYTPLPYKTQAISPLHPALNAIMMDTQGHLLTRMVNQEALVVVPSALPSWAKHELLSRYPELQHVADALWNGQSTFFHTALGWHIDGLYRVQIQEIEPVPQVPVSLVMAMARAHHALTNRPWQWTGQGFRVPSNIIRVTPRLPLMRALEPVIPSGGSVVILNGQGQLLAQESNPLGRALSWQPHPLGKTLIPVLLAMALNHPQLFRGLTPQQGPRLLNMIGSRWGNIGIHRALLQLGFGQSLTIGGQPVTNPPLPKTTVSVLSEGTDLWGTSDEVARAYLLLVDEGKMPAVSWFLPRKGQGGYLSLHTLVSSSIVSQINGVLPQEDIGMIHFNIWRPSNPIAVAYTSSDHGMVIVLQGTAASQTVAIVQQAAAWLSQNNH